MLVFYLVEKGLAMLKQLLLFLFVPLFAGQLNVPHHSDLVNSNTVFSSFSGPPKTLDPSKSYSADSNMFIAQVVEPPLGYSYYDRPYKLAPLAAKVMPVVTCYNKAGQVVNNFKDAATTHYDIYLRNDLVYAPHPAFAKVKISQHLGLFDYEQATRKATAQDFVYAIKRLASPKVNAPIFSIMAAHIQGFSSYNKKLKQLITAQPVLAKPREFLDLDKFNITGVEAVDQFHYRIITKGYYRPFIYWLAMPFFAPIAKEVDKFYANKALPASISYDWFPVGTGAYKISKNNPNNIIVLEKNPEFHADYFPASNDPNDAEYSQLAGQKLPLVDRFVFTLEKESISSWNKFLQGYYDSSGVSSDNFDQVIALSQQGDAGISPEMKAKGVRLAMATQPAIFYTGFNMLDPVVGGASERARLLRQAISIAINQEEFLSIFLNGRGVVAQGPIPNEIWGGEGTINPYVYDKNMQRRSLDFAKKLLVKAGYPSGIDPKTNAPLVLTFDTVASSSADDKSRFSWYRSQFRKLGITLDIEATQYNRFQDKMRKGQAQIYNWGWVADYPDPENFLFLLYGPNGKVKFHGENASNYSNPEFDKCFVAMRDMENSIARRTLVAKCVAILQHDSPWVWGFSPKAFSLTHTWIGRKKPHAMTYNTFKYTSLNYNKRRSMQDLWNMPNLLVMVISASILLFLVFTMFVGYHRRQEKPGVDLE